MFSRPTIVGLIHNGLNQNTIIYLIVSFEVKVELSKWSDMVFGFELGQC